MLLLPVFAMDFDLEESKIKISVNRIINGVEFRNHLNRKALPEALQEHRLLSARYLRQADLYPLTKNGVLVHLTDVFPKEGRLIAGAKILSADRKTYIPDKIFLNCRPTLHFTVDKAFYPHYDNPGNYPFAILIPVGFLDISRLRYGCDEDVMIVGDVDLSYHGVVILCPEMKKAYIESISNKETLNLINYYDEESSVREAVNQHLYEYYGRPVIKAATSLDLCPDEHITDGNNIINAIKASTYYISKYDLNPYPEFNPTLMFYELGAKLQEFVPIQGSGFMWLNKPKSDDKPYFQYDNSSNGGLILSRHGIMVNGERFDPKKYFEDILGLQLKWVTHEESHYYNIESSLCALLDFHHPLIGKKILSVDDYKGEIVSVYKTEYPEKSINKENIWGVCRDILQDSLPNIFTKLNAFYEEECKYANKIVKLSERKDFLEWIEPLLAMLNSLCVQ